MRWRNGSRIEPRLLVDQRDEETNEIGSVESDAGCWRFRWILRPSDERAH